jgi:hypothetical protein
MIFFWQSIGEEKTEYTLVHMSVKNIRIQLTLTYRGAMMAVWYGQGSGLFAAFAASVISANQPFRHCEKNRRMSVEQRMKIRVNDCTTYH